jgi:hypothetical protein
MEDRKKAKNEEKRFEVGKPVDNRALFLYLLVALVTYSALIYYFLMSD